MTDRNSKGRKAIRGFRADINPPVIYSPRHGLLVSTHARYPETARDKIVCASAMLRAARSSPPQLAWVVDVAVTLLDQAGEQLNLVRELLVKVSNRSDADPVLASMDEGVRP